MSRWIGRENLRKRLGPLDGAPGSTRYEAGRVEIETGSVHVVVRPPFGLAHEAAHDAVRLEPLWAELDRDRVVAVLLVRLGGYAVGVFDGERLVASKVGSRFVKNRNKKGGSSSNRFRRRREEQARALVGDAADTAVRILAPWRDRAAHTALGGDRWAVDAVLDARPELAWLRERAVARFFTVPDPRQPVLERLPYDLYAAEVTDSSSGTASGR